MSVCPAVRYYRVLYRPYGMKGSWAYGWSFPSDSLLHANETVDKTCRVKDKSHRTYDVQEIILGDFDYPKAGSNIGSSRSGGRCRSSK
jgi:hypothetical protein